MIRQLKIGMAVELNDQGLDTIGGLRSKKLIQESQNLHVTGFHLMGDNSAPFYLVDVDQPEIGQLLFTNFDLDEKP